MTDWGQLTDEQRRVLLFIENTSRFPKECATVCYMESSLGANVRERYEQDFDRRHDEFNRAQSTSYGYFQFMGFNLTDSELRQAEAGSWPLSDQVAKFDVFFAEKLQRSSGDVREAFRRYNGSGPQAENYAERAFNLWTSYVRQYSEALPEALPPSARSAAMPFLGLLLLLLLLLLSRRG